MASVDPAARFASESYQGLFARIESVRTHRDKFLADVAAGTVRLEGVFARSASDPVISGMKVLPAIEGISEYGKVQTRRAFADVGIDEADHLMAVSSDSMTSLPAALDRHAR